MKKFRNILAMLMVFVMLVAVMPMNVFAEGDTEPALGDGTPVVTPGEGDGTGETGETGDGEGTPATDEDKTAAKATVNALTNISEEDKAAALKAIEEATTKESINEAVAEAKTKDDEAKKAKEEEEKKKAAEELKKAKEEALAELDKLTHLTDAEKEAAKKAINDSAKKEDVTKALDEAKAKEEAAIAKEEAEKEHNIEIKDSKNGKVEADKKTAKKGEEVTLTITPDKDYKLKELKVMAGETAVKVVNNKFTMPAANVTVTATFEKKAEEKPDTKPGYYNISVYAYAHGTAKANTSLAKAGDTITVTATPSYGYAVKNIYYIDNKGDKHSIKNYAYNDYYYYGYNGRYYNGYYGDYYRYYSDYENNYYYDYSSYDAYLKDRHYSFWNNGYRYWDDYDYKYYNKYYDRYYDDYYRYYDDYVDNYYRRYSSYEDYLYDKHYSHYRDYRYYDKYDYRYYNYTTTDTFRMPASDVTVYVEFTDWSYYGYYYDDYYYYRYHRDKKDKEKEEKTEEEKKPAEEKTPQVFEASATINVGSNVFTKVNKNVTTTHQMDVAAYVKNGRVMLPLRYVAEALGLQVSWVPQTKTVIIWDLTQRVEIPIKSNKMIVNGVTYTSDVKPEIKNSRTMLPIANVARALGLIDGSDIIWDPVMKQVKLTRRVISK